MVNKDGEIVTLLCQAITGFEAQELDNNCILKISETIQCKQRITLLKNTGDGRTGENTGNGLLFL